MRYLVGDDNPCAAVTTPNLPQPANTPRLRRTRRAAYHCKRIPYLLDRGLTGVAHVFIEAAANIRRRGTIDPDAIVEVLLRGEPHIRTFCEPLQTRRNPQAPVEVEDSVGYDIAGLRGGHAHPAGSPRTWRKTRAGAPALSMDARPAIAGMR